MSHEIFSAPWADAWAEELRASSAYRQAAATWEGSMIFETADQDTGAATGVFLDLWHGECRAARPASERDQGLADYVIRAQIEVWQRVLAGDLEPIFGLMSGKLQLLRGSLAKLTPQLPAARELVAAAARIDTVYPTTGC